MHILFHYPLLTINILGIMGTGANFIAPLLHRLLIPTSGAIFLGNRDVSNLSKRYLQHHIGIVPTDPYIYSATIRYIFCINNSDYSHLLNNLLIFFFVIYKYI